MQIEVVDDHSTTDDPEAVVRELGHGRVGFYRQPKNVGYIRNFETCLMRSQGELVHLLHCDDRVRVGFYESLGRGFDGRPDVGAAFSRASYIDEDGTVQDFLSPLERADAGILDDWLRTIASGQRVATPSVAVRREAYEQVGAFDRRIRCAGEDWEMWVRIASNYAVWFEPEPLVEYRVKRTGSLTGNVAGTPKLVRDMRLATKIVETYLYDHLPRVEAADALRRARAQYAHWALNDAEELFAAGRPVAALSNMAEALRCSRGRWVLRHSARVIRTAASKRHPRG